MMRTTLSGLLLAAALAGCEGVTGPMGDKGDRGEPGPVTSTLTLLVPTTAFAARQVVVQVSGVGTHFSETTSADLGDPGVRTVKVEAGSPGNLRLLLDISDRARIGPHDLTVVSPLAQGGEERATLRGGFNVNASLLTDATGNSRMVPQGGLAEFAVSNLDAAAPFLGAPTVTSGPLVVIVNTVNATQFSGILLVDALAPAGQLSLSLSGRDGLGRTVTYTTDPKDPGSPQIAARPATTLESGMTRVGESLIGDRPSNLYALTTAVDDQVALLAFTNLGSRLLALGLRGAVAPPDGRFGEGHFILPTQAAPTTAAVALAYLPKAATQYVAVSARDNTGGVSGYGYDLSARAAPATRIGSLKEPMLPDGSSRPLQDLGALTGPNVGLDGAIDNAADSDFIKFKATKNGRIFVQASVTGTLAVPSVVIYQSNCTTLIAGARQVQQEITAVANSIYCARISGPPMPYQLIVAPEP